jgi:MFS transporter, Spinster family, sphingosine-1-phosphate transporter
MSEQAPTNKMRPGAITALCLLLSINLFNYIDRYVLAAVVTPLKSHFNLADDRVGWLQTAFLYAYMVCAPLLGRLAGRWSRWWVIGGSVAIWSLASGWSGLAGSFGILLMSRILVGIGEAGYGPAAPALISDYFPIERRGMVMSLFYLAMPVGSALGYVIGGMMNKNYGWQSAFYVVVIPGIILSICCFMMRDPGKLAEVTERKPGAFRADVRVLLRIPSYLYNTAAMTVMTFAIGGIAFWMPHYMQERYLTEMIDADPVFGAKHALASIHPTPLTPHQQLEVKKVLDDLLERTNTRFGTIVVVAGLLSTFMGGWLADKLRKRWRGAYFITSGCAIVFAFPCTLAMLWTPFPYAWYAVFGAVFFLFFNTGPANTALANVTSSKMRATAFALNIFIIHAFGDAISPPLIGWMKRETKQWEIPFVVVSLMMLVASVLWLIGSKYLARDEDRALAQQ